MEDLVEQGYTHICFMLNITSNYLYHKVICWLSIRIQKMNNALILDNINKRMPLQDNEEELLINAIEEASYQKNGYILRQGKPNNYLYFVNEGALRAFHINAEGKDSTLMFAISDWWIGDMYSFLNDLPSLVSIQAVKSSQILRISKEKLENLYAISSNLDKAFRILIQHAYAREQYRIIQNISLPAKERYELFLKRYPLIANSVPQKHIASYLGVTPEFLSALRAKKD